MQLLTHLFTVTLSSSITDLFIYIMVHIMCILLCATIDVLFHWYTVCSCL